MKPKRILLLGASGQLAKEFQSCLARDGIEFRALDKVACDITNPSQVRSVVQDVSPDVMINCAAYNAVDQAEEDSRTAYAVNARALSLLAELCVARHIFLVHYSSDYVFDGKKKGLYTEEDPPNPLNVYGRSKLQGEQAIQEILSDFLIFRVSWVIGPGRQNFLYKLSEWIKQSPTLKVSCDEVSVPTFTKDIVRVTLLSLEKQLTGLYHLTNGEPASRYELARSYFQVRGLTHPIVPVSMDTFPVKAKRPRCSAMSNRKISQALNITIPSWKERIKDYA